MTRCSRCGRRVWFWQRKGWRITWSGTRIVWHKRCYWEKP